MDFLQTIVAHKREEVAARKRERPLETLALDTAPPARGFASALRCSGISVIAEIKRRSPSKGALRADLDPLAVARGYESGGAAAISVLTDERFFGGSAADLVAVREVVSLPVLRKDFIIEAWQIHESRAIGADAILLIVRALDDAQLREYLELTRRLGIGALVEVHDEAEIERALSAGAEIVGVNNRDLDTFDVSLETALRLAEQIPPDRLRVAESGIQQRADVIRLQQAGYDAVLVGEALMRSDDPGAKLGELLDPV